MRKFMTAYEAAEVFGVTFRTVYAWVRSGKLRAVKIGRKWFIPRAAVDAMLEKREQPGISKATESAVAIQPPAGRAGA